MNAKYRHVIIFFHHHHAHITRLCLPADPVCRFGDCRFCLSRWLRLWIRVLWLRQRRYGTTAISTDVLLATSTTDILWSWTETCGPAALEFHSKRSSEATFWISFDTMFYMFPLFDVLVPLTTKWINTSIQTQTRYANMENINVSSFHILGADWVRDGTAWETRN